MKLNPWIQAKFNENFTFYVILGQDQVTLSLRLCIIVTFNKVRKMDVESTMLPLGTQIA